MKWTSKVATLGVFSSPGPGCAGLPSLFSTGHSSPLRRAVKPEAPGGVPGAKLEIFAIDSNTGERLGGPAYSTTIGADGRWGPFNASGSARYEFVVAAPGYATLHNYRSPFPRSSDINALSVSQVTPD